MKDALRYISMHLTALWANPNLGGHLIDGLKIEMHQQINSRIPPIAHRRLSIYISMDKTQLSLKAIPDYRTETTITGFLATRLERNRYHPNIFLARPDFRWLPPL